MASGNKSLSVILMKKTILILFFFFILYIPVTPAEQEAEQSISEFNITGFAEEGKKNWEISGKSADVFEQKVELKEVVGKLYGEQEDIMLTAQKGDFDKTKGNIHLEENVVITTTEGAKLTTQTLDWDRDQQRVSTKDVVNIQRDNMIAEALGAFGQPDLKKLNLEKDVLVQINTSQVESQEIGEEDRVTITCDGPLEVDYEKNIAIFYNNVKVDQKDTQIYSDRMDVYFVMRDDSLDTQGTAQMAGNQIEKIVAQGNVKIRRGENVSYSNEAVYDARQKKIVLTGRPKLVIHSNEAQTYGTK